MYEIWEVVRFNDYDFEPLILVSRTNELIDAIKIRDKQENYILMVSNEN